MEHRINKELDTIIEPKIPFTALPNPIGAGILKRTDNTHQYIPLYYVQKISRKVINFIILLYRKQSAKTKLKNIQFRRKL